MSRTAKAALTAALACAALLVAMPGSASADILEHRVKLEQHGYKVVVGAFKIRFERAARRAGPHGFGYVAVQDPELGWASYQAREAVVTRTGFKFNLDRFGHVSVNFHPYRDMDHDDFDIVRGRYRGTIRLRDGSLRVAARGGRGKLFQLPIRSGRPKLPGTRAESRRVAEVSVEATRRGENSRTTFRYHPYEDGSHLHVVTFGHLHDVQVSRRRTTPATGAVFTLDPSLTSASFVGADPLLGSAEFTAPSAWLGDLSIPMLGDPHVRLAGPQFKARIHIDL